MDRRAIVATAAVVALIVHSAAAEGEVKVSTPRNDAIENPFLASDLRPTTVADEPQATRREPTTYQNPFAKMSQAPPIDPTLRPGPVSRWQRPLVSADSNSVLKSNVVTPVVKPANPSWVQITNSLTQPESVIGGELNELPRPNSFAAPAEAALIDRPDGVPALKPTGRISSAFDLDSKSATSAVEAISPDLVAHCSDTPQGWLSDAQQAAASAETPDDFSMVIDLCDRGIRNNPPAGILASLRSLAAWAHNRRGESLADAQRSDDALKEFQDAIAMDPACSLAIHNRGVTLAQRNQYAAALRDFNRVIELNPGLAIAYRNRAELLAALGRSEEAVADYTRALESIPNDASLLRARAHAHQRLGDFARSTTDLTRAIELAPQDPDGFTQRGNLAAEQGKFEQARDDFRHAMEIDPNWADACRSLAWLQATCPDRRFRDATQAVVLAEQAARLALPDDYLILDTLAAAHAAAGHFEQAVEFQKKSLAAAPREASTSLEQRLAMYQRREAFSTGSARSAVRTASHEARPAAKPPRKSPTSRQIVR